MAAAIEVGGLRKSYGAVEAVRGVDFSVSEGEVYALLGPNGAGKTTTVEILEGHRRRDAGDVSVLGFDPARGERDFRERVGIVLQSAGLDPYLTAAETVDQYRAAYPAPRSADEVLELVGLSAERDTRVLRLSGGQQRRLDVAVALAGDPPLLFMDEPTTGFDPSARRNAWGLVRGLADLGKTILLTTHYMDEAQALSDRVGVIVRGEIVAEGPPATLAGRHLAETVVRFRAPEEAGLPPSLAEEAVRGGEGWVELITAEPTRVLHDLTGWAVARDLELEGLEVRRPSLEDVYLQITGGAAADEGEGADGEG
ncbi:MAG: ABC transporter ATP-binding protein [Actinobacteria bacterium]|nr:ABC transporter ATP-binding protein [Actinomycetota bacterium]